MQNTREDQSNQELNLTDESVQVIYVYLGLDFIGQFEKHCCTGDLYDTRIYIKQFTANLPVQCQF